MLGLKIREEIDSAIKLAWNNTSASNCEFIFYKDFQNFLTKEITTTYNEE